MYISIHSIALSANQEDHARSDIRARGFRGSTHQCAFLTLMCSAPTRSHIDNCLLNPATNVRRRSGSTNRESLMWNMECSLHLCSAPWRHGKACPDILCLSFPSPIHQTTDQICSNNGTDPVQNQLFFDGISNYAPSWSSLKCQSCKQSL